VTIWGQVENTGTAINDSLRAGHRSGHRVFFQEYELGPVLFVHYFAPGINLFMNVEFYRANLRAAAAP
jgi:hypothetical protein